MKSIIWAVFGCARKERILLFLLLIKVIKVFPAYSILLKRKSIGIKHLCMVLITLLIGDVSGNIFTP
jgi:hypothetical protein